MKEECEHNWKKVYYRKVVIKNGSQDWKTIPNTFVCDKCLEIKQLK
jgi:hypothetical protein